MVFERFVNWLALVRDTIVMIYRDGWAEYRAARRRYDQHQRALEDRKYKYSKKGEIARSKEQQRRKRR